MIDQKYRDKLDVLVKLGNEAFGRSKAREQLTCLVVLRLLDIEETRHEEGRNGLFGLYRDAASEFRLFPPGEEGAALRWRYIIAMSEAALPKHMENAVFPFLRGLGNHQAGKGLGCLRIARFFNVSMGIKRILSILDSLPFGEEPGIDAQLYEYLLSSLYEKDGVLNRTLRPGKALSRAMVELVQPKPGDVIADPNCFFEDYFLAVLDYLRRTRTPPR